MIRMSQLHGLSLERAELYGKPHVGARYTGLGARKYERTQDTCCICGKPAASCHHVIPLSHEERFTLATERGAWNLRSPLFALCGSGTTGCHNTFHGGARYVARWIWDKPTYERDWWDGTVLENYLPHSRDLYLYGYWAIEDKETDTTIEIRDD